MRIYATTIIETTMTTYHVEAADPTEARKLAHQLHREEPETAWEVDTLPGVAFAEELEDE